MTNWIIENAQWILLSLFTGIGTVWGYITDKKSKDLKIKLEAADAKLKELQVDAGHMDLNDRANDAVEKAVDRILKIKSTEIATLEQSYQNQLAILERDLITLQQKHVEAQSLKEKAGHLADSYKKLIDRLRDYNNYLKSVLDVNGIKYKEEDELL